MRLQGHDCFIIGCDGTVLVGAEPGKPGEKEAMSNVSSLRFFEVIDEAKQALERRCPDVISFADIIVMAAHDTVIPTGSPKLKPEAIHAS